MLLRYSSPRRFQTHGGDVSATEIMLALDTRYGPEPAVVKDGSQTIGLKKCGYDDRLLPCHVPGLAKSLRMPPACPPGMP